MALEYIDEIKQDDYTLSGVTDENYPLFNSETLYRKNDLVIFAEKIYEAKSILPLAVWYVYDKDDAELYIPSEETYVDTVEIIVAEAEQKKYIYLDDAQFLYKYIGQADLSIDPALIDFTDASLWQNLGKQLNGYSSSINYPDKFPLGWEDQGFVNSKRAFDNSTPSQTVANDEEMVFVFNTGKVERIAFFELDATEITVKTHLTSVPESPDNTVTKTYELLKRKGLHFYEILTADLELKKTLYIEVPTASVQEITITIKRTGSLAKVGDITLGRARTLGVVLDGVSFDNKEYSTYSSDSEATDKYKEGGYRNVNNFTVSFPTNNMESIKNQLDERRGKVTVYNMDPKSDADFLKLKGFMRSRPISFMSNNTKSKINIKVEGRIR